MRVLSFTAGAANMICGSCLRDNALAKELMRLGHEVVLMPIYTPTLTDETNVSEGEVLFSGINVWLQQNVPLFRRTPRFLDRVFESPSLLRWAAQRQIKTDPHFLGAMTVSMLDGEAGVLRKEFLKLGEWLSAEPEFDIINIPFTLLIAFAKTIKGIRNAPVICTLQGEDLFLDGLDEPYRTQALDRIADHSRYVDAFVAVSDYYAHYMVEYLRIPEEKVHAAPLGISLEGHSAARTSHGNTFHIGYLARIAPEKGLHVLADAYHRLRQRPGLPPSKLLVAGWLGEESRGYLAGIERQMREWGLGDQFEYRGVLTREEKIEFLHSLDVLSVPTVYPDPKGTFVLEAMANSIPVVQPRCGAFPEIIETTGGGLLVEPNDPESLAEGLLSLWEDPDLALELGHRGYDGLREHYTAAHMARRTVDIWERVSAPVLRSAVR